MPAHSYNPLVDNTIAANGRSIQDNFKGWFRNSVVQEGGAPLRVYHGTTNDVESFDLSRAEVENQFGLGYYFSNSPTDVEVNYACEGNDLANRIHRLAERLANEEDESFADEACQQRAREMISQELPNTMAVYLRIENPLIIGGKRETFLDYEYEFDPENEDLELPPTGTLAKIFQALEEIDDENIDSYDPVRLIADIQEAMSGVEGMTVSEFIKVARASEGLVYAEDLKRQGMCDTEILRRAFEAAGFDGIIDRAVYTRFGRGQTVKKGTPMDGMTPDTVHYTVFKAEQIKSATGNSGLYLDGPSLTDTAAALALERAAEARSVVSATTDVAMAP